jgi:transposase-like protein
MRRKVPQGRSFGYQVRHRTTRRSSSKKPSSSTDLGQSIPKVAKELGAATEPLRRWIKQHEIDEDQREGLITDEPEELF